MNEFSIRHVEPSDYPFIISVVNDWWSGRNMADMLPKLFFVHFRPTSFVAVQGDNIVGFLIGFVSQTFRNEAYIHFSGVHPAFRKQGIGNALYEHFFETVKTAGCTVVRCLTSPVNKGSVAFHQRMGFSIMPGNKEIDGIAVAENYDGRGGDRVLFYKSLVT
ncbi:MAG: GNAT family N-acetyltransferase [Gammaproteobacteria bacterium]|nr:GNAT family N-acetyltransferase [Gammaproteobacteria bacterium]